MHHDKIIENFIRNQLILWVSQVLQKNTNEEVIRAGIRLLALCTQTNEQAQEVLANDQKRRNTFSFKIRISLSLFSFIINLRTI